MVTIAVPSETTADEARVALVPESVAKLVKAGARVIVQRGAGDRAGFPDDAYVKAGATLAADAAAAFADAAVVVQVRRPTAQEAALLREGTVLIALLQPSASADLLAALAARKVTALALERVPRITRAQSMDVLSSQSTVAGYKAVLIGAAGARRNSCRCSRPPPARSRRPRCSSSAPASPASRRSPPRAASAPSSARSTCAPPAQEQVQSLGATFVAAELGRRDAEGAGGYAQGAVRGPARTHADAIAQAHRAGMDLVITTALIPGQAGAAAHHRRDGAGHAARLGDRRPGRRDRRQLRADQAGRDGGRERRARSSARSNLAEPRCRCTPARCSAATSSRCCQHLIEGRRARTIDPTDEITGARCSSRTTERSP